MERLQKRLEKLEQKLQHYIALKLSKCVLIKVLFQIFQIESSIELEVQKEKTKATVVRFQVKTGSEYHSTSRKSAMVFVNGIEIYKVLKSIAPEWELIGNKGAHGKYCIAEYDIPVGSEIVFKATANGIAPKQETFIVTPEIKIDIDGFIYNRSICGWIVSL